MKKIQIIGYLGRDCESKQVNNSFVTNFSVAVTEKIKNESLTTWFDCSIWNEKEISKVAQFLKKGTQVFVEGNPKIESYLTKSGEAGAKIKIEFCKIELLGGKNENKPQTESEPDSIEEVKNEETKDDLPF